MQVGRRDETAIAVTRDAGLLGYNHKKVYFIDSYSQELFRCVDLTTPDTPQM